MPFKKLHRIKQLKAGAGGRKTASLGKRVLGHVGRHKKAYAIGGAGFALGRKSKRKEKEKIYIRDY